MAIGESRVGVIAGYEKELFPRLELTNLFDSSRIIKKLKGIIEGIKTRTKVLAEKLPENLFYTKVPREEIHKDH